jgi:DNA topoisomerase-1
VPKQIKISARELQNAAGDPGKSSRLFNLVYVSPGEIGILRKRQGRAFRYFYGKGEIIETETLARIQKLAIPPAWKSVWICSRSNGHLQATGVDALGRKQYRYHALWNQLRSEAKFFRLFQFGKTLPMMRRKLDQDLSEKTLSPNKVLAAMVMLMENTAMRIGNSFYEKLYGSFGLTTLKNRHVEVKGNQLRFAFRGKKDVLHSVSLRSRRLAQVVKKCLDVPERSCFNIMTKPASLMQLIRACSTTISAGSAAASLLQKISEPGRERSSL